MSRRTLKFGWRLGLVVAFFVVFEGFVFLRWTFFSGTEPSPHDLQTLTRWWVWCRQWCSRW